MLGRLKFGFGEYIGMMFANDKFDVPLKGLVRTIWNSPDGGGATIRGMLENLVGTSGGLVGETRGIEVRDLILEDL